MQGRLTAVMKEADDYRRVRSRSRSSFSFSSSSPLALCWRQHSGCAISFIDFMPQMVDSFTSRPTASSLGASIADRSGAVTPRSPLGTRARLRLGCLPVMLLNMKNLPRSVRDAKYKGWAHHLLDIYLFPANLPDRDLLPAKFCQ